MISAVACGLDPSSYLLTFGLDDTVCRMAGPLLPGFPPSLVSSLYTLSAFWVSVVVPIHWPPWFCPGIRCHCGVLCDCQRGLVLLMSTVADWVPLLTSWPLG